MSQIKPVVYSFENIKSTSVKADLIHSTNAFEQVLKNQSSPSGSIEKRVQAIENFYEVHQRSQITGVPTAEYKAAVKALGLNADNDHFAAIRLLQDKGYDTGTPSLEAILKYGAAPQTSGNQSFLAQTDEGKPINTSPAANETTARALVQAQHDETGPAIVDQRPDLKSVAQEIQALNEKFGDLLGPSNNFFEAVTHMSQRLDIAPYLSMTLDKALPKIAAALEANQLSLTTDRWLKGKVSS